MTGAWIEDLTWPEVDAHLKAGALVVVPVGAIAKEHADGPDYSRTGVRGDPTLATTEKGRALLSEIARELIEGLVALYPDIKS